METKSLFYVDSETIVRSTDENGNPAEGTRITVKDDKEVIMRFRHGFLDGDSFTKDGKLVVQPAVETEGHIEYWREGKLHRDGSAPAVYSRGFTEEKWWEDGMRKK